MLKIWKGPYLILGLGNPGVIYATTRHNLGFMILEALSCQLGIKLNYISHYSQWGKGIYNNREVILALPQTYMNLSGQATQSLLTCFNLQPKALVVIHDDLDQQPGKIKIIRSGGAGGHKGLQSILQTLNNDCFLRVKVGIGRPRFDEPVEKYVLNSFYNDQYDIITQAVQQATECLQIILTFGPAEAMQRFHRRLRKDLTGRRQASTENIN